MTVQSRRPLVGEERTVKVEVEWHMTSDEDGVDEWTAGITEHGITVGDIVGTFVLNPGQKARNFWTTCGSISV